jgi:menaquinone-dependent protoporphyrinogen oxidase
MFHRFSGRTDAFDSRTDVARLRRQGPQSGRDGDTDWLPWSKVTSCASRRDGERWNTERAKAALQQKGCEMKALVAVASKHGNTLEIGEVIAGELRDMAIEAWVLTLDAVTNVNRYDAVILGSAVYMGRWLPEARRFVEDHLIALREVPVWLFSSGPIGDPPKPVGTVPDMEGIAAQIVARDVRTFAGRLDPADLGLGERLVTKAVRAPRGDFRQWDEIRSWAREIGAALIREQPTLPAAVGVDG